MSVVTYKCPNCGGGLIFDPEGQNYKCEYCLAEFSQAEMDKLAQEAESVMYTCPSCGAQIVTDATTIASFCYYCHNPIVLQGRLSQADSPDQVIPFAIDKEKAVEIFTQWIKTKKYTPKAFFSPDQIEKISGVYFPYWLYSCEAEGHLTAEGVKTKAWTTGNTRYIQNEKYLIERAGHIKISNMARTALKKANRKLIEGVLPFQTEALKEFKSSYMAGFFAENHDIPKEDYAQDAKSETYFYAKNSLLADTTHYSEVHTKDCKVDMEKEQWNCALLPVWALTYRDAAQDKEYYFACNGQTGKVCGLLPISKAKLAGLFAKIFVPIVFMLLAIGICMGFFTMPTFMLPAVVETLFSGSSAAGTPISGAVEEMPSSQRVFDGGDLFTAEEEAELQERIEEIQAEIDADFLVITTDDAGGQTATDYADDFYDKGGYGTGARKSGAAVLIDMDNREIAISTSGKIISLLDDDRLDYMIDRMYEAVSEGQYYECGRVFLKDTLNYYVYKMARFGTIEDPGLLFGWIRWYELLFILGVAGLTAGLACRSTVKQYRMEPVTGINVSTTGIQTQFSLSAGESADKFVDRNITQMAITVNIPKVSSSVNSATGNTSSSSRSSSRTSASRPSTTHRSSSGRTYTTHRSSSGRSHGGRSRKF